jgi:hypothetical protein
MTKFAVAALILLGVAAIPAHAAPQCLRLPPVAQKTVLSVNNFAQSPQPQAIAPGRGRCGWALGLAAGPTGTGTAFIVGNRREVITNLHVVDKDCRGNRLFTFEHGFAGASVLSKQTATVVAKGDYCAKLALGRHDYSGDWAIAVLRSDPVALEPATHTAEVAPLEPRIGGNWLNDNGRYYLLGYSMSFRLGTQPYSSGPCRLGPLFADGVVEHNCDAGHRTSGAPIMSEGTNGRCLVGAMHVGEIEDVPGRPVYRADVNANVAVLANRFAAAVEAVALELAQGRDASAIALDLGAGLPRW